MGVNICIAPQWCKCRCVCWVVSAHWVTTVKHNIHQLIHSESINTPQLILCKGNLSNPASGFVVGRWHCSPLKPHPLHPTPRVSPHLFVRWRCTKCLFCGVRSTCRCVSTMLIFCPKEDFSGCLFLTCGWSVWGFLLRNGEEEVILHAVELFIWAPIMLLRC